MNHALESTPAPLQTNLGRGVFAALAATLQHGSQGAARRAARRAPRQPVGAPSRHPARDPWSTRVVCPDSALEASA